jgi:hypothetical protein
VDLGSDHHVVHSTHRVSHFIAHFIAAEHNTVSTSEILYQQFAQLFAHLQLREGSCQIEQTLESVSMMQSQGYTIAVTSLFALDWCTVHSIPRVRRHRTNKHRSDPDPFDLAGI